MNILLIGHQGFVGTPLYRSLSKIHNIIGCGRKDDISLITESYCIKNKIDYVINLSTYFDRSLKNYSINSQTNLINVEFYKSLINIVSNLDIPIIQFSSKDVFGYPYNVNDIINSDDGLYSYPKFLINEKQLFNPITPYAKSKLMSEFITESAKKYLVIRLNTIYTCEDHKNENWIHKLCKKIKNNENISITNMGYTFRDPLHIDDLTNLIKLCLDVNKWNLKLNVGGGEKNIINLNKIIKIISKALNKDNYINDKVEYIISSDNGFAFDNKQVTKEFNWKPQILFEEAIKNYIKRITKL